uniref:PHD-type domain-containing protein n=1 Tax=Kalanchoe fedtschenkoi TaxID=63787 RepID=A0A7N0RHM4_KALFE
MEDGEVCLEVANENVKVDGDSVKLNQKRGCEWVGDEVDDDVEEGTPNKKLAKEVSNDEVHSEVSNPVISHGEIVSSSQTVGVSLVGDLASRHPAESRSRSSESSSEETETDDEYTEDEASATDRAPQMVVREIPELLSSTGVRKITFKFSKNKEDYGNQFPASATRFAENYEEYGKKETKADSSIYPSNVKKLISTGILNGARVKYKCLSQQKELDGIIKDSGYLCGCSVCNFSRVLSAYEFEMHAGGRTRHPNNHIFLENGSPIYSIIQKLKTAPLNMLDEAIKEAAGSSINEIMFQVWKARLLDNNGRPATNKYDATLPNWPCVVDRHQDHSSLVWQDPYLQPSYPVKSLRIPEEKSLSFPLNSTYVIPKKKSSGATRKRDNDLHRLLFLPGGLPDGAELAYYMKGKKILGGYKQGNGILCSCCDTEVSPSQFEAHAGWAARRQPYRHIYTSSGLSLHDIATSLASGQTITTDCSDDMCTVCGDGGNLKLCDECPRAFHIDCLETPCVSEGEWFCPYCKDKAGTGRKTAAGDPSTVPKSLVIRLNRVVKAPELESGGCVVCRAHDFSAAKFDDRTVMICDQCEKEYHVGCLRESGLCDLKELPKDKWFCCEDCSKIYSSLQTSVSVGAEVLSLSVSSIIIRKLLEKGYSGGYENDVHWRILSGKSRYPEHLPILSRAATIFRECFDPIVAKSGRDLIPVMVYGRNISGQEFGGMYCVVLIVRSVVVSAGLVRVFGREVAELPMAATSREHQGKGYFQALFSCIMKMLCSLNVENLVLPAAEEAESIWTNKFGFRKMSDERLQKYTREVQLTIFKKTSMLEKKVELVPEE